MLDALRRALPAETPPARALLVTAGSALGLGLLYALWRYPYFVTSEAPLWAPLVALVALALLWPRLPLPAAAYWGAGLLTYLWSLAPGNTLLNSLWELGYLAALLAGGWRAGLVGLNVALLGYGLFAALTLYAYSLQLFASGSVLYVAGAQALLILPWALRGAVEGDRAAHRLGAGLVLVAASYLALISGARAVYLPLVLIVLASAARLTFRRRTLALVGAAGLVGAALLLLDVALPNRPLQTALTYKAKALEAELSTPPRSTADGALPIGEGALPTGEGALPTGEGALPTGEGATRRVSEQGAMGSRLLMWDQTLRTALARPLGTGTGSFRATVVGFQRYPSINFSSPHNVVLETAATGGWLRLALLLGLLLPALWRGWRSPADWPWAVGAAGLWTTLAFDVTASYPAVMMLAFAALGPLQRRREPRARPVRVAAAAHLAVLLVGTGLLAWWYLPCHSPTCGIDRYRGLPGRALDDVETLAPEARRDALTRLATLYPKSPWVLQAQSRYADDPLEGLELARLMVERFPLAGPGFYLDWAERAEALGRRPEARRALLAGLERFPPGLAPAGIPLVSRSADYQAWLDEAARHLEALAAAEE